MGVEPIPETVRPLVLVDAFALLARGHHALPPMTTADGLPTSGLYGLASTLIKLLAERRPRATACALDGEGARRPMAPALARQVPLARALVEALGFRSFVVPGAGAKDVLATLAAKLGGPRSATLLVACEHDLAQAVRPGVTLLLLS